MLTGNSGIVKLGGMAVHIAEPYSANGMVFVKKGDGWERVPADEVGDREIITCYWCDKPAVAVSHYGGYQPEDTCCQEHYDLDMAERIGKVSSVERGKRQIAVCAYCNANEQLTELSVKAAKAVMRRKGWRNPIAGWVCALCYIDVLNQRKFG